MALQISPNGIRRLSSLPQFHGVPTGSLIRVAAVKTGLQVTNRWAAIALIVSNPCPIPVAQPDAKGDNMKMYDNAGKLVAEQNVGITKDGTSIVTNTIYDAGRSVAQSISVADLRGNAHSQTVLNGKLLP
jgi:hypothetical protein